MHIDQVSTNIIKLALYLDKRIPGLVSEIWIDGSDLQHIKASLPSDQHIQDCINETRNLTDKLEDTRRKSYLHGILESLVFQIENIDGDIPYSKFTEKAFGFRIERVTSEEILEIVSNIESIEKELNLSRQEIFKKHSLKIDEYQPTFEQFIAQSKNVLPEFILNFPDEGFEFETVTDKPWSAFNSHIAPFRSKLTLNSDVGFTKLELFRLAFHEAYGGHHSELSNKDKLLIDEQKGEHGLIITFSPQTFVSEAIAEGVHIVLGCVDRSDKERQIAWYYDRLIFALYNLATFMFFDDKSSREEIAQGLNKYPVSQKSIDNILNFSMDPLFGKYAPVYYTAFNFIEDLYASTDRKDELIQTLFKKPCTPKLLKEEFLA